MRILFVSTNLPVPTTNGQAIRTLSIVRGLRSLGHELAFVSFAPPVHPAELTQLSSLCRSIDLVDATCRLTNMSQRSDYFERLRCLLSLKSYSVERFRSPAMQSRIEQQLRAHPFDLIICDSVYVLINVPSTDVPIALNCHNVEHVILLRYAALEKNLAKKSYARLESRLLRQAEQRACSRVAVAMSCSGHDCDLLKKIRPDLPVFVVPNTVDTELLGSQAGEHPDSTPPVVLFQGGMDWYPNRDAVEYFAQKILPFVRAACPKVKFVVAGRNPPAYLLRKFRKDGAIEFTGTVSSMLPYLSAATVLVCPLRLGSGTRLKILEGCAVGKPVVSTTVGAEGLNFERGKEILLADEPAEFASWVIEMLNDRMRARSIGSAARMAVLDRYSEPALKASLQAALSALPNSRANALDSSMSADACAASVDTAAD